MTRAGRGVERFAIATAPAEFTAPAPCVSTSYGMPHASLIGKAVCWSIALSGWALV